MTFEERQQHKKHPDYSTGFHDRSQHRLAPDGASVAYQAGYEAAAEVEALFEKHGFKRTRGGFSKRTVVQRSA